MTREEAIAKLTEAKKMINEVLAATAETGVLTDDEWDSVYGVRRQFTAVMIKLSK